MNILIVDDHATNRKLLRIQLESENHTILEAGDGIEALGVLERESVDAIVSDILMPNMDGFGLCHAVRQHARLHALPLVIYTATYTSTSDMNLAQNVGADRYVTKPAPIETMLTALDEAVRRARDRQLAPRTIDETAIFKQYNATLIGKLEEKNSDLQALVEKLERAHERIAEMNRSLERRVAERTTELAAKNTELTAALANVKELSGLLPICCQCKAIRNDQNYWSSVEEYVIEHTHAMFTHGICPECYAEAAQKLELVSPS